MRRARSGLARSGPKRGAARSSCDGSNGRARTAKTLSRASRNSRQWLRRLDLESPGGKKARLAQEALDEQDRQQFALDPGARRSVAALGHVPEPQQGLQALEADFDLPPRAIEIEDLPSVEHRGWQRTQDVDVLRELERLGPYVRLLPRGLPQDVALRPLGGVLTLANGAETSGPQVARRTETDRPLARLVA